MAGPFGVNPVSAVSPVAAVYSSSLRAGQLIEGTIQGSPGALLFEATGLSIPLAPDVELTPGQHVTATVIRNGDAFQLRILARTPEGQTPPPAAVVNTAQEILGAVLSSLGSTESPETAAVLLPSVAPLKEPVLRTLLSVFVLRDSLAADLTQLAQTVRAAAARNAIPIRVASDLEAVVAEMIMSDETKIRSALSRAVRGGSNNAEAWLAKTLTEGFSALHAQEIAGNLRNLIGTLSRAKELRSFLQAAGKLDDFDQAMGRTLDRLSATQLHNLRSLDLPYWFIEIPCHPEGPLRHVQIHVLADGKRRSGATDAVNATIAFDISTSRLGDMWIALQVGVNRCSCWIHSTDAEAVRTIEQNTGELVENLEQAGYPGANVQVAVWDGNRLQEAARLMQRVSGIDMTV